jgi:hypothetical protein
MTNFKCALLLVAGFTSVAGGADASSPSAWAELYAKAGTACIKASNLASAAMRGQPVDFSDVVLLVIDGRFPQPHMKNAQGRMYCLYNKISGATQIAEAATVSAALGRTCWSQSIRAKLKSARPIGTTCTAKTDEGDDYQGVVRR